MGDRDNLEHIGNLGIYVGEYIGSHGEELFERSIEELAFRAVCWATGTQMVRFSTGANEMIDEDLTRLEINQPDPTTHVTSDHTVDPDDPKPGDGAPVIVHNPPWDLAGICPIDQDGETMYDSERSGVSYREIEGAEQLDPPKQLPPDRPLPKQTGTSVTMARISDPQRTPTCMAVLSPTEFHKTALLNTEGPAAYYLRSIQLEWSVTTERNRCKLTTVVPASFR